MSGSIIQLFPRRVFTFTNVATSQSLEMVVVKAINVADYTQGTLVVRVHSGSNVTSTANIKVLVKTTAPTPEDPASDFVLSTAVATATVDSTITSTAPTIVVAQLSSGFGGMVQISVAATQASGATIVGALSAELVMRA